MNLPDMFVAIACAEVKYREGLTTDYECLIAVRQANEETRVALLEKYGNISNNAEKAISNLTP